MLHVSINIKIWSLELKSMTGPQASFFRLQLKECGKNVNINMGSNYKSGVNTLSSHKRPNPDRWMTRKLCSSGAWNILLIASGKPGAWGEPLNSQPSWEVVWILVTRVCPVFLVHELVLVSLELLRAVRTLRWCKPRVTQGRHFQSRDLKLYFQKS